MLVVHLTASRFFGGPERQMLGLAKALLPEVESAFLAFHEDGLYRPFLEQVDRAGFQGSRLQHDTPHLLAAQRDLRQLLCSWKADVLCCHSTKPNLLGLMVARRLGVPVFSVSRGWTGQNSRVRVYDMLDRRVLRWMDGVVCVSEAQAQKVRRAGVSAERIVVIHNAVDPSRFAPPKSEYRQQLLSLFPAPPAKIVGAAGRLSPEKGFHVLVDAASDVARRDPSVGFVLFGEGPQRDVLARQIETKGLQRQFILAGFHADLDQYFPQLDLFVLPSFTEGLPNVVLEAFASRVPVVATRAGGTPEVVTDRETGYLVTPGDCHGLADRMSELLHDDSARLAMGQRGRRDVEERFSFVAQAQAYQHLFQGAVGKAPMVDTVAAAQPLE